MNHHAVFLDDEEPQLSSIRRMLRHEPLTLHMHTDPLAALEVLRQEEVALFFSDKNMPKMDGFEALAAAKEIRPQVMRGLITGQPDLNTTMRMSNEGLAQFFLFKPLRKDDLLPVIQRAIRAYEDSLRRDSELDSARSELFRDALTGLWNRRYAEGEAERLLQGARQEDKCFSLLFLDLNKFKRINDTLGHESGDEALRKAANALQNICRETDIAARFAGDEFLVLLPGAAPEAAQHVIKRLHQERIEIGALSTSFSVGLATFPEDGQTLEMLIHLADTRMYEDKRQRTLQDAPDIEGGTLLLVDDEESMLATLQRHLRHETLAIKTASTVQDAIAIIDETPLTAIISDYKLHQGTGIEILSHAAAKQPNAARILLTAHAQFDISMQAIHTAKVQAFLTKPWKQEGLIQTLRKAIASMTPPSPNR